MSRCCHDRHNPACCESRGRRAKQAGRGFTIGRLIGGMIRFVFLYLVVAFVAGTFIQSGNPTLGNIGEFTHLIMFVEPLEYWLISNGVQPLGEAVHVVANGMNPMPMLGSVRAIL